MFLYPSFFYTFSDKLKLNECHTKHIFIKEQKKSEKDKYLFIVKTTKKKADKFKFKRKLIMNR